MLYNIQYYNDFLIKIYKVGKNKNSNCYILTYQIL